MPRDTDRATVSATDEIRLHYVSADGTDQVCRVRNLGPGGLAVRLPAPPPQADSLDFRLVLEGGKTIRATGRMVWSDVEASGPGEAAAGLAFVHLDDYARAILDLWLKEKGVLRRGQ